MSKRGRFITLEGGEGVGVTNMAFVEAWLTAQEWKRCEPVSRAAPRRSNS